MDTTSKTTFLEQFPLFNVLDRATLSQIAEKVTFKAIDRFDFIYMPDQKSNTIYFLVKGNVKIGTHFKDGKEVIKSILHPNAMFGEHGLIGEEVRQDFAQAMNQQVHLCILRVDDFKKMMENNHRLCLNIIQILGTRLQETESRLESLIFKDARTRIIDFLKETVRNRGRRIGYEMLLKHSMTQQDIANLTGTSRQTVTSVLNELRNANLIYFNRKKILIRDMANLA